MVEVMVRVNDDMWVKGGSGQYTLKVSEKDGTFTGSWQGKFNDEAGCVTAQSRGIGQRFHDRRVAGRRFAALSCRPRRNGMRFGCAWYPEHWPEGRWPEDLSLMRDAGMNVVRVAEFAWSRMEPAEGRYEFDWLERAIQRAADAGLDTVLGTPTAAPPAWMTSRYPEVLAVRESGHPERHGGRGHYSPANPRYQRFCVEIASAMAGRFGRNPHVIGWQIDNEYWPYSFDPYTLGRLHAWLKDR